MINWTGTKRNFLPPLSPTWPTKRVPNKKEWDTWKEFLRHVACGRHPVTLPLGPWLGERPRSLPHLDFLSDDGNFLYQRTVRGWRRWRKRTGWRAARLKKDTYGEPVYITSLPDASLFPTKVCEAYGHAACLKTREKVPPMDMSVGSKDERF